MRYHDIVVIGGKAKFLEDIHAQCPLKSWRRDFAI